MTIPTQVSLHGYIATAPDLHFAGSGEARFHARAGIQQWRKEQDGSFTELASVYCDLVMFGKRAERAYDQFRPGDEFIASGYINEFERQRDGHPVACEEFVARQIGHDAYRTKYTVERRQQDPPRPKAATLPQPAVGI